MTRISFLLLRIVICPAAALLITSCTSRGNAPENVKGDGRAVTAFLADGAWELAIDRSLDPETPRATLQEISEKDFRPTGTKRMIPVFFTSGGSQVTIHFYLPNQQARVFQGSLRSPHSDALHSLTKRPGCALYVVGEPPDTAFFVVWSTSGGLQGEFAFFDPASVIHGSERGALVRKN